MLSELLHKVGLDTIDPSCDIKNLSTGQQMLLALAYAIAKDDPILLLDELLSPLDFETKHKVLKILKELAAKGKSIFLVFHEEDHEIKECMDTILYFNDHTIIEEKNNRYESIVTSQNHKKINQKIILRGFIRNSFMSNLLYILLISSCISFALYIFSDTSAAFKQIDYLNNMLKQFNTQCTIYYNPDHINNISYDENIGIPSSIIEEVENNQGIEAVYPISPFKISSMYNYNNGEWMEDDEIGTIIVDESIHHLSCTEREYLITPYFENSYDDVCTGNIDQEGILYLSYNMAKTLEIDEIKENTVIQMNVLVPVNGTHQRVVYAENGGAEQTLTLQKITYQKESISVRLRGIIDQYYPYNYEYDFILPYSYMKDLYNKDVEEQSSYEYPRYCLKLQENVDYTKLESALKEIDENIVLEKEGQNVIDAWYTIASRNEHLKVLEYICVIIAVVICLIDSYSTYRHDQSYISILKRMGISDRVIRQCVFKKILSLLFIMIITGLLFTVFIFKILNGNRIIVQGDLISSQTILINILLLLIIGLISQFKSIKSVLWHEKI